MQQRVSTDSIRGAVGKGEASRQLHQKRSGSQSPSSCDGLEQFTADSRVYQSLTNKAIVLAGLQGCSAAAISFALIRSAFASGGDKATVTISALPLLCRSSLFAAIPTGLALAYTSCSGIYHERRFRDLERSREEWEMRNYMDGERDEMIQLYAARGIAVDDAATIVDILSKSDQVFLDMMMMEELGYSRYPPPNAVESLVSVGLPTAVSFVLAVAIPHVPAAVLGSNADSMAQSKAIAAGEALLVMQTLVLSLLQAKLLLGAYTQVQSTMQLALCNGGWVFACYHLTGALKRLCCFATGSAA